MNPVSLLLRLAAGILPIVVMQAAGPASTGEPTNATEAAAKKIAEDQSTAEAFGKWKSRQPPEQQAWETVLEQNLGSFYLPIYQREKVAGKETAWDFVPDNPALPRVLLIGDSISRGYTLATRHALAAKVNVHRAPENCGPTANGLKKLAVWLGDGRWDVIHFNFGIHDRATPAADYEQRLEQIVQRLRAAGARLIWASSTPLPAESSYGSDAAIVARNEIAARVMQRHGIPINDLYAYIAPRLKDFQKANDVHFSEAGYEYFGARVAAEISAALPGPRGK
jgi:lysophospholipase L1-like esterase